MTDDGRGREGAERQASRTSTADWVETAAPERFCPKCEQSFESPLTHCPDDDVLLVLLGEEEDPLIGKNIRGAFTLKDRLGKGGMGVVYLAWQHSVGREVAVKVMSGKINRDPEAAKRFFREAKLASRLSHPNIVTVHDFGQDEDRMLYIVMEYLTGATLREALQDGETFDVERTLHVAKQMCDALEAAHDATIVHRDLKPGNIILMRKPGARDFIKVLDFGIAKSLDGQHTSLTQSGAILGTPAYLPPEVALDGLSDARSDLYSLGVILYQLLAGRLPFVADDIRSMIAMHASEPPPPLPARVPDSIAQVVYRLMAKDPAARYQTAADARAALVAAAREGGAIMIETGDIASAVDVSALAETTPLTVKSAASATTKLSTPASKRAAQPAEPSVPMTTAGTRRRRSATVLVAALVGLVAVAGLFASRYWRNNRSTTPGAGTEPARTDAGVAVVPVSPARRAPIAAAAIDAGAPAERVKLEIKADDAEIYVNHALHSTGYAKLERPRNGERIHVKIVRPGYKPWERTVFADRDQKIEPTLDKLPRRKPIRWRPPKRNQTTSNKRDPNKPTPAKTENGSGQNKDDSDDIPLFDPKKRKTEP